jgi:molybdopterin-binding protein
MSRNVIILRCSFTGENRKCGPMCGLTPQMRHYCGDMPHYPLREAAALLGVSDDTVRRWIDSGSLPSSKTDSGRWVVEGAALAEFSREHAAALPPDPSNVARSARNRFVGLVTKVVMDGVMAQVELQCGPHTVVSLMSAEAARDLRLEPGKLAVAVVKATTVIVETPGGSS